VLAAVGCVLVKGPAKCF